MRIVHNSADMERALRLSQSEAGSAFGDSRIFIEKYLKNPRHIEFQILSDAHGHCIHLFERECSIQRRHQKVIEEAPAPQMTEQLRSTMGEAAIRVARACDYAGAGTIEFLVDHENNFYFMEMNTRLQVEHPVTEFITGLDLVAEQIRIAEGEHLQYSQSDMNINGHAIECRIYAEDPPSNFMPNPGAISFHQVPSGVGVRVDSSIIAAGEVPIHYDPLISKVVTWGNSREQATQRMIAALDDYQIAGVKTTRTFCQRVMESHAWRQGHLSTHFLEENPKLLEEEKDSSTEVAAVAQVLLDGESSKQHPLSLSRSR